MRLNSITPANIYPKAKGAGASGAAKGKSAYERHNIKQNNNEQINTTIKMNNSDGRVSFKGGVPFLHRAANFTSDNPLVAEALFAILITCLARPITIMATAKNEEEKEKCSYQAAKSISSGVVGLAMTALVATPLAAGVRRANESGALNMPIVKDAIKSLKGLLDELIAGQGDENLIKLIKDFIAKNQFNLSVIKNPEAEQALLEGIQAKSPDIASKVKDAIVAQKAHPNYMRTCKNVMDKLCQPVFMPLRATITVALVPILLGLVGKKKPEAKKSPEQNPQLMLNYTVFQTNNEKELFQSFSGVANHANK